MSEPVGGSVVASVLGHVFVEGIVLAIRCVPGSIGRHGHSGVCLSGRDMQCKLVDWRTKGPLCSNVPAR